MGVDHESPFIGSGAHQLGGDPWIESYICIGPCGGACAPASPVHRIVYTWGLIKARTKERWLTDRTHHQAGAYRASQSNVSGEQPPRAYNNGARCKCKYGAVPREWGGLSSSPHALSLWIHPLSGLLRLRIYRWKFSQSRSLSPKFWKKRRKSVGAAGRSPWVCAPT